MQTLIDYAKTFLGLPYIWGGDDFEGYDCSGLVQEILSSVGMDPAGDQTAHDLFLHFDKHFMDHDARWHRRAGSLAFYGSHDKISHVAFMIDRHRVIESAGGGHKTLTAREAATDNAFCRIRPLEHRRDLVKTIYPQYPDYLFYR